MTSPGQSSRSAIAAAVAVAADQGVRCAEPVVLRDAWHVLLHLRPAAIVARVSSGIPFPAGPMAEDVVRELAVARHAARAGAPVVPPAEAVDPGPHRRGGHIVTFWQYLEPLGEADPETAGRGLRLIHDALADYDGALPRRGHGDEVLAMLEDVAPSPDVDLLRSLAAVGPPDEGQALHGDAHLGNCLAAAAGPLWHDFESACRGPREYDLAALALADRRRGSPEARRALAAYGEHDAGLLDALLPVYAAWVYASMLLALPRRPDLQTLLPERFDWLRAQYGKLVA